MKFENKELEQLIDHYVKKSIDKYKDELVHNTSMDIRTENGNASIKQSGNSLVYVDNTGIAYAFMLFYKYMVKDQSDVKHYDELIKDLEKLIIDNRKTYMDALNELQK
ncbi:MAG: hypothetical protein ABS948_16985 [Solibacillus sp.]